MDKRKRTNNLLHVFSKSFILVHINSYLQDDTI